MIIGIPKEIKNNENRVALTPAGAQELVKRGHTVYVQATAGVNSGFADEAYTAVGAEILPTIGDVYARAEMIVKVKEPIAPEYKLIRKDQLVFTFFHFASSEPLTRAMIDSGAVCCAYETVERADRSLPLLIPMSEVAGRMSTQEGRYFLEKPRGGKGKLLGGVPGVKPAKVFVIGAGVVGTAAARTAAGTGADVTICDISLQRLTYLADVMPKNVKTLMSSEYNIREELKHADLVIGSVLIPGAKAPKLVTRDMLREMEFTMSTVSSIIAWPTFPAPCPIPRRLRSPTPRFPTSSSSPTRAGAVPARKTANWNWGSTSCRAKWSTGPSPRPGGFPASRWRCNAVAGFPARSGFSCGDADLAFTPNKKWVVCIPPAFFVYLDDDPEIAAHTPLLLFGHVLFLHGREHRVGMGGLAPRPDNRPVVPVGQGGGLSALSLCLDRPALR